MVYSFAVGEIPLSISGDPGDPSLLQHTVRDVGAVSRSLATAGPGTRVGVRGPFGTGWEVAAAEGGDVLVVAGGIGLAPLRPALLEICARRDHFGDVTLVYGARTPHEVLFGEELHRWADDHSIAVHVTVDRAGSEWRGQVGLVTRPLGSVPLEPARTRAFVCGPEVMMRHVADRLVERGVPPTAVRLSMERHMKCGVGLCGHCQLREHFVCVDGPVLDYETLAPLMRRAEL
jgi:NAD(P)H-flavin reductase